MKTKASSTTPKRFLGMYGLRPLGGTLQSDDGRKSASTASTHARHAESLNEIRMDVLPDAAAVRKAIRPRRPQRLSPTRHPHALPAPPARAQRRVLPLRSRPTPWTSTRSRRASLGLLDQLGSIDEQIKVAELAQGLPARARLSDLNKQKATVLRTLAALEKARIAASN